MLSCSVVFFGALAIVALIVAIDASSRASKARREGESLRTTLDALGKLVADLRPHAEPTQPFVAPAPPPRPKPAPATVVTPPPPPPKAAAPSPPPPQLPPARPPTPPPKHPRQPFDWESLIGVKLFSWIAGVSLVLAAIFFLKYSVEHGWLRPAIRAAIGLITGTVLIVICELRVARGYKATANALHGAGIAILYATLFATYALWHLAAAAVVFGAMFVVTAVAVALSIRRDSIFISLLGLLGGFATPALLSTGENRPIGLFTYLLLLNVALAWVAMVKRWPLLTAVSVLFTVMYQWAWIGKFLTAGQLPLAAAIFVVFAVAAGATLWVRRKEDGSQRTFDRVGMAAAALPLLFAIFTAAVPAYGARFNVLFTFLLLITIGLAIVARLHGPEWLHLLGGLTTLLVLAVWLARSYSAAAWPATLVWLTVFVLAQLAGSHFNKRPTLSVAPLLFVVLPALAAMERATASPLFLFLAAFALLAIVAAYAIYHDSAVLYLTAAFFVIAAEAIWSAKYLTPDRLIAALEIYGIFGIFFLGVPLIGRRFRTGFGAGNASALLLLASIALLFFIAAGPVAKIALWGLALLLAIVNAGAMAEARSTAHPLLSAAAILLSWIVIAVWCGTAMTAATLIPALAVIGGFAILALAGNAWASGGDTNEFANTTFLALAGHVFLLLVASQKQLAFPPWPIFAVLLVLDLAIGVAAIYVRRWQLMTAALALSQAVLLIWTTQAAATRWPLTSLIATLVTCGIGLAWYLISEKFASAAIVALFLGGIVAIVAGQTSSEPLFALLLAAHSVILLAILFIAWQNDWHELAVFAVPLTAIATALARTHTPAQTIEFAAVLYAFFIAYPLLLGNRAQRSISPYLAAVLASIPFFVFVRRAMIDLQLTSVIGVLPLFEALLMMALLLRLLRIEPPRQRLLSRLALVSAAALAFITVAIPLQLDKQWITIGWALEASALVWLFLRIPHQGLLAWAAALFAAVFVRLVFNPAVFSYHPVSHTAIVNWYLYTYGVCAAAFFTGARLLPRDKQKASGIATLSAGGTILLFFLLNIEIADYYSIGRALTFNFFSSSLAQDLTYTIGWALFAIGMLVAGIILHSRATRVAAILLLVVTVLKCFLHDLARLGGLYRVGSLLGLAISLVVVGILLQKFVMASSAVPPPQQQEPS